MYDSRAQTESMKNNIAWLSNDASAISSFLSSDANKNDMNESKIVDVALHDNGLCVNVANNNDVGVAPRGHTALLEYAQK